MGERSQSMAVGVAVFVAGAAVLGVEIAASRVLAPFFGNSLYVWGSLIGIVLSALAVGYWVGGALADRFPHVGLLAAAIAAGALAVLAIPAIDDPVLEAIVSWDPGPRANPVLATIALFGIPSVLLATVSPIAVRLRADELRSMGRTAGRLFAISTAGSIAGTFATAFWLIPEFGTEQLLGLTAAALFLAVALVSAVQRLPIVAAAGLAATAASGIAAFALAPPSSGVTLSAGSVRNWSPLYRIRGGVDDEQAPARDSDLRLVYRKDTAYHRLAVMDDGDSRYLRFSSSFQSGMWRARPFATRFRYTDFFNLGLAYNPAAKSVLFVGLGGGSAPKRMWRDFPQLELHAVELDPEVVRVAHRYFGVPRHARLEIDVGDGRQYLTRNRRRYDVIAIDAFFADSVPFHLTTREFLDLVRERLNPGGVVVVNAIGALRGPESRLFRAFYRTHRAVFPTVAVHPVYDDGHDPDEVRNLIIVSTDRAQPEEGFLLSRWRAVRSERAPSLADAIRDRWNATIPIADVPTLTDDYAPTDALLLE